MKTRMVLSLALIILLSIPFSVVSAIGADSIIFSDISSHWAKEDIEIAVEKGIVNGYPDGTFRPDLSVTRAEFIKMLVMALNLPHSAVGLPWYQTYVAAAIETGFHDVDRDGFNGFYDQTMTRLEMMRVAIRAVDSQAISITDNEYVLAAVEKGILRGMGKGELALDSLTTRAQALTVIQRIVDIKSGKTLDIDLEALKSAKKLAGISEDPNDNGTPVNNKYGNVEYVGKGNSSFSLPMHEVGRALMIELIESIELVDGYIHLTVPEIPNPYIPGINQGYNIAVRYNDQTNAENEFQFDQIYIERVAQSGSQHKIPYNNGVGYLSMDVGEVLPNDYPILEWVRIEIPSLQMTSSTEGW